MSSGLTGQARDPRISARSDRALDDVGTSPLLLRWLDPMIKRFKIADGKLIEDGAEDCPIAVYSTPDENERRYLTETLKIDEHTLASSLDPDELARLETEEDHVAIIFKRPRNYSSADNFLFKVYSYGLFLFPNRVVIVQAAQPVPGEPAP